jgi:aldose 1-epimerase
MRREEYCNCVIVRQEGASNDVSHSHPADSPERRRDYARLVVVVAAVGDGFPAFAAVVSLPSRAAPSSDRASQSRTRRLVASMKDDDATGQAATVAPPSASDLRETGAHVETTQEEGFDAVRLCSTHALEATFAPQVGLTCCSLRHAGEELLGQRFGLGAYASGGTTMGMSLMHPWADRLSSWTYSACGATVRLPLSPLLHTDRLGLPVNGVQESGDAWLTTNTGARSGSAWLEATLPFDHNARGLELFPFPHRVHLRAELVGKTLSITSLTEATGRVSDPVCFGFRLYLRRETMPGETTMVLPARQLLLTDERLLPTGATAPREMSASSLGDEETEEVFALGADRRLTFASELRRVTFEALDRFRFAQVRSLAGEPHVMVEALTAAPDALSRGAFAVASPGRPHRAELRISVDQF